MAKRQQPGCCACGSAVDAYCCVCFTDSDGVGSYGLSFGGLADADMTVTLDSAWDGRTTFTLTRIVGLCSWQSTCFQVTTGTTGYYRWTLINGTYGIYLKLERWASSSTCSGLVSDLYVFYASSAPSVNPLSYTATVGGSTPPGAAGATTVTVSQSGTAKCYWTPFVSGCFGAAVSGALAELIYSSSTFASGTTGATGYPPPIEYTSHAGQSGVTYKVSATGYNDATGNFDCNNSAIASTNTIFLTTASGYCCQQFRVLGCLSQPVEGAVVTVYNTSGGTQLAQGTTDVNGEVALHWTGSCSIYATVTHSSGRYADYGSNLTLTTDQTKEITLSAGTGYRCTDFCNEPISETLSATDVNGTWTLTYDGSNANGAGWYGCATYTSMAGVVTSVAAGTCVKTTGTANTVYLIKVPATGTTLANYWGGHDQPTITTSSTPTCSAGALNLNANIPVGCTGTITQKTGTATGTADACPEALSISATMPATGTNSTANPGAGDITITE